MESHDERRIITIVFIGTLTFLILSIGIGYPQYERAMHTKITTGHITTSYYYVNILTGTVTSAHYLLTVEPGTKCMNGLLIVATIVSPRVYYTYYIISNNTTRTTTFNTLITGWEYKPPSIARITYDYGYLTFNNLSHCIQASNPIVFATTSTIQYSDTFFVNYNMVTITYLQTSTIYP